MIPIPAEGSTDQRVLLIIFGAVVALVVWIAKSSMKRQAQVQDRAMTFMENQLKESSATHAKHAAANEKMAEAVKANTNELKTMARKVRCQAAVPVRRGKEGS